MAVNKNHLLLFLMLLALFSNAQLKEEAYRNFNTSAYTEVSELDDDAVIIYDRKYHSVTLGSPSNQYYTTIHRKIKINSLYGLNRFNKIYIPTYDDLNYSIELHDCQIKVLKSNNTVTLIDTSQFETSTFPANAPFYYKRKGEVKMIAISDLDVGDEIEYVYTLKNPFDYSPYNFSIINRVKFSSQYHCYERSLFFEGKGFETQIKPVNFNNGMNRDSDFKYKNGTKVTLKDIDKDERQVYANSLLDQPYILFSMDYLPEEVEKIKSWEKFTKAFKAKRRDVKHSSIFNGDKILTLTQEINQIPVSDTKARFELILDKINTQLEDHFYLYDELENDVEIALSYAKSISKFLKNKKIPANFHFVTSKYSGEFDPTFISLSQFDNIIVSFVDQDNRTHFFPLLEPYSDLGDIKSEFQGTKCLTIHQNSDGRQEHSFGSIPLIDETDQFKMNVSLTLRDHKSDSISYLIQESIHFVGEAWRSIKPYINDIDNDSLNKDERLRYLVESQFMSLSDIDSIYQITYQFDSDSLEISYKYSYKAQRNDLTHVESIKPDFFLENDFETPFHLRESRSVPGYIYESDLTYKLTVDYGERYNWIENELFNNVFENSIGQLKSTYENTGTQLSLSFNLNYKKAKFEKTEWSNVITFRDVSFHQLNSNLYFKKRTP